MPRYIDADALKEKYGDYYAEEGTAEGFIGTVGQLIDNAPTVDDLIVAIAGRTNGKTQAVLDAVRPKGKWIVNTGNSYIEPPYFCSECNGSNNWKAPFCEHCGADMRGDV